MRCNRVAEPLIEVLCRIYRHDRLVHGTVPRDVSWLSESVSVHILVVLMVDWSLSGSPFAVCIRYWRVLGEHSGGVPEEQIGIIDQSLSVHGVVIHDNGAVVFKTTTESSHDEEGNPRPGKSNTNVEVANWELTDSGKSDKASNLSTGSVVCEVLI